MIEKRAIRLVFAVLTITLRPPASSLRLERWRSVPSATRWSTRNSKSHFPDVRN